MTSVSSPCRKYILKLSDGSCWNVPISPPHPIHTLSGTHIYTHWVDLESSRIFSIAKVGGGCSQHTNSSLLRNLSPDGQILFIFFSTWRGVQVWFLPHTDWESFILCIQTNWGRRFRFKIPAVDPTQLSPAPWFAFSEFLGVPWTVRPCMAARENYSK